MRARIYRLRQTDDDGIGMLAVIFVAAIITALVATVSFVTVNNIDNTGRDRHALSALGAAEGGVAQALQYLRGAHLASITCDAASPSGAGCDSTTPSWTSAANPHIVTMDPSSSTTTCDGSEACAKVWIGHVQEYEPVCSARTMDPAAACTGIYRVHSTGYSGGGPAARRILVDVEVQPFSYPLGVYAKFEADFAGNIDIYNQSLFAGDIIIDRNKIEIHGDDLFYGGNAGANARNEIYEKKEQQGKSIHQGGSCSSTYPYDRSGEGVGECYLDPNDYPAWDLTADQYEELRITAIAQGTYNLDPADIAAAMESLWDDEVLTPVLYWDEATNNQSQVEVSDNDFSQHWFRPFPSETCGPSAIIVARGPNLGFKYKGGNAPAGTPVLSASVFVPNGKADIGGAPPIIGTLLADSLEAKGGGTIYMDQCFADNPPGGILDVKTSDWREADSEDVN